ncbi:hypothetical protein [Promicromonospora sp. NPDC059942]|uniref:hypothetical protein n=1 Tax=Promicromonospora sp. NPDC059942 TaxID=3347009 RepID=UPI00365A3B7B
MGPTKTPLVNEVDWSRLFHAYGVAADTSRHLQGLVSDDDAAFADGLDHLHGAVLHQGTVYPATVPSLRVVAGMLHDPALRRRDDHGKSRLASLLEWIDAVGDSASWHEDTHESDTPEPTDEDVDAFYRAMAADDESVWDSEVNDYLWGRSIAELPAACGEALTSVSTYLTDDDPAIRACAALSLMDSAEATALLVEALHDPLAADVWFARRPSCFDIRVHFALVANLLARDAGLAELLPAFLPVIRAAKGRLWSNMTWGPILLKAFPGVEFQPGVRPDPPRNLDEAQKAVLRELVANNDLWDGGDGNANLARMRVGLPDDRDAVAALAS